MQRRRIFIAILFVPLTTLFLLAGRAPDDLRPQSVTFSRNETTILAATKSLNTQTGNLVEDRRANRTETKLSLPRGPMHFWPALDAIGKQTGIGFSPYQPDGAVAWVDAPYRELKTHYSGIFRFAVKSQSVTRHEETLTHVCNVTMDIAWEPRFHPLYLHLEGATVKFSADAKGKELGETLERQTARSVAGAGATELELRMQAPDRTAKNIAALQGAVRVIGAPKMLDFAFTKLREISDKSARNLAEEGVKVTLTYLKMKTSHWSVDVVIENPPGAILLLESFQSWMDNNRIWLEWTDSRTKTIRKLESTGERLLADTRGPKIRYEFEPLEKAPLPAPADDVTLHYRTPNRVAAYSIPFEFRDVPLP